MKKRLTFSLGCVTVVTIFICSMFVVKNGSSALPLSYVEGNLAYDVDDLREAVGVADYVFVGTVMESKETYHVMVTEEFGIPFTNFSVQVAENIKGSLITECPIEVTKEGGVSLDKSCIIVFEDDEMPNIGGTYIFRAFAQSDGSLLISGPKSNILLEDYGVSSHMDVPTEGSLLAQYVDAYENEIDPHCRESQISIYDTEE